MTFQRTSALVEVRKGRGRANAGKWYLKEPNITAAHEFGHLLGNIDEYNGACDGCPARPVWLCSIMNDQHTWRYVWPRHFEIIRQWVERLTCSEFEAAVVDEPVCETGVDAKTAEVVEDLSCGIARFFWPAWHT